MNERSSVKTRPKSKNSKKSTQQTQFPRKDSPQKNRNDEFGGVWNGEATTTLLDTLPPEMSISVCLNHVIDTYVRKVLPWQVDFLFFIFQLWLVNILSESH
jgi:hypothetical protein